MRVKTANINKMCLAVFQKQLKGKSQYDTVTFNVGKAIPLEA